MDKKIFRFIGWTFLLLVFCYILFIRSFLMHWSSTKEEKRKYYAGDSILLQPDYENTLAVTIDS